MDSTEKLDIISKVAALENSPLQDHFPVLKNMWLKSEKIMSLISDSLKELKMWLR